jgi:membrane protease YdiL (CAAX protease family)
LEALATSGPSSGFLLVLAAAVALLALVVVVQTARGRLRPLWLNRHGLLRVAWRLVIFVVLLVACSYAILLGTAIVLGLLGLSNGSFGVGEGALPRQILAYLVLILALFAASAFAARLLDRRPIAGLGLGLHSRWPRQLSTGLLLGLVLVSAIVAVQMATGTLRLESSGVASGLLARSFVLTLVTLIGTAFFEELLFRGYLLQVLAEGIGDFADYLRQAGVSSIGSRRSAERLGKITASVFLAAPFGFAHLSNEGATVAGAVSTGTAGLVLSLAYFRTRSLWVPVGIHTTWNFCLGWVFSLPVSGELLETTPFVATVSGPVWFSGGSFGPEGSVLTFLALIGVAVFFLRSRRIDAAPEALAWYPPPQERVVRKRGKADAVEDPGKTEPVDPETAARRESRNGES